MKTCCKCECETVSTWSGRCEECEVNYNKSKNKTQEAFDPKAVAELFSNVEEFDNATWASYKVLDEIGNETGILSYVGSGEWHIFVDNFPSPKRYYSTNLPILSVQQFINDIARTGLTLKWNAETN